MRWDTARIKRLRVRQEMEIKRYKSLNWIGLELPEVDSQLLKKDSSLEGHNTISVCIVRLCDCVYAITEGFFLSCHYYLSVFIQSTPT